MAMIGLAVVLAAASVVLSLLLLMQRRRFRAASARVSTLCAALGTISGTCYRLDGEAARVDANASSWPERLSDLESGLDDGDRSALGAAVARFACDGAGFFLRVRWLPPGGASAMPRLLEISGHLVEPAAAAGKTGPVRLIWLDDITEKAAQAAQQDRQESERRRLAEILDRLPVAVWWRDADLTVIGRGGAAKDDRQLERLGLAAAEQALAEGTPAVICRSLRQGAVSRSWELVETPLTSGGSVGLALDRTELDTVRAELARLALGHREVLEAVSTAIAIYGPDMRLVFCNSAFSRLWGIDRSVLAAEPTLGQVLDLLHEERALPETANFPRFKSEETALFETLCEPREEMLHLPDGRTIRQTVSRHPFGGLTFVYDDVTDRLALERSYNTLMEVQRESLDNLFEGIAVFGSDGRLTLSNPAFARIWQVDGSEIEGRPHVSTLVDKARDFFRSSLDWEQTKRTIVNLVTSQSLYSGRLERRDGRILELNVVPLPDGNVLWSFLDVTDSARVQRVLQERNDALEASSRLKSEFIANVSYELRTPLNAIIGFAEILSNQYFGELNPRQLDYARGILEGSHRLLALVDDILDLATIEAGHMSLERASVDVHDMLCGIMALARDRAERLGLTLVLECTPDIGAIQIDQRRIRQALFNLVSNAIKFTPAGGRIVLRANRGDDEIGLTVADTGIGIAAKDQPHVFDRFERGDRRGKQVGAGLGLALVKSFVELHGGRVELDSNPGKGTRVTCWIPLWPRRDHEAPAPRRKAAAMVPPAVPSSAEARAAEVLEREWQEPLEPRRRSRTA